MKDGQGRRERERERERAGDRQEVRKARRTKQAELRHHSGNNGR